MAQVRVSRRRHRRVAVRLPVRISTIDPETDARTGRPFFRASRELCCNISPGGAFVRTPDPPAPGRRVLLELELPGGPTVAAIGRVAWCRGTRVDARGDPIGLGVEFLGGASADRGPLAAFLDGGAQPAS